MLDLRRRKCLEALVRLYENRFSMQATAAILA